MPRVALAWKLARPLADVERSLPDRGGVMFVTHGTEARRQARLERRFGADAVPCWRAPPTGSSSPWGAGAQR